MGYKNEDFEINCAPLSGICVPVGIVRFFWMLQKIFLTYIFCISQKQKPIIQTKKEIIKKLIDKTIRF